jgi:hypothetical protein
MGTVKPPYNPSITLAASGGPPDYGFQVLKPSGFKTFQKALKSRPAPQGEYY